MFLRESTRLLVFCNILLPSLFYIYDLLFQDISLRLHVDQHLASISYLDLQSFLCKIFHEDSLSKTLLIISGDGFGNRSYLMVHLFTLANLLVQFRRKKTTPLSFLSVFTIKDALSCQMYKCWLQFNNIAAIILRQDVRHFATELDDGRYVTVPATGRDDDRAWFFLQLDKTTIDTWHFLQLHEATIGSVPRNNRATSSQTLSAKWKCSVKCDATISVTVKISHVFCTNTNF